MEFNLEGLDWEDLHAGHAEGRDDQSPRRSVQRRLNGCRTSAMDKHWRESRVVASCMATFALCICHLPGRIDTFYINIRLLASSLQGSKIMSTVFGRLNFNRILKIGRK